MNKSDHLSPRDLERLSAYIDGECSSKEAAGLEARLLVERGLRKALEELRATAGLLRALPEVLPPRRFVLTPEMVGVKPRRSSPMLRLATALASIAFAALIGLDAITTVVQPLGGMLAPAADMREMAVQEEEPTEESMLAAALDSAPTEGTLFPEPPGALGMEQPTAEGTERSDGFAVQTEAAAVEEAHKGMEKFFGTPVPTAGVELPAATVDETALEDLSPEVESEPRLRVVDWLYWRIGLRVGEIAFGLTALVLVSLVLWTRRK